MSSGVFKVRGTTRMHKPPSYGTQRVNKLRPSTGIYGRHVGGPVPNNAVRQRGRR